MDDFLETLRMELPFLLDGYNEAMREKGVKQITFDQWCDEISDGDKRNN